MLISLSEPIQSLISNLIEWNIKTPLIKMDEVAKILNIVHMIKTFIE